MIEKIEKMASDKGWTLYRLAKEAGLTPTLFYVLKKNNSKKLTFETVVKIADALGVSLDEFRK